MLTNNPAAEVVKSLKSRKLTISFAESLTGGMIASELVSTAGASQVFSYGFVCYSDEAKHNMLGIKSSILSLDGAVSEACAAAMAENAARISGADISVSVTGLAGPHASEDKYPVGTVFLGIHYKNQTSVRKLSLSGSRTAIREKTTEKVFILLHEVLS